MEILMWLFVIVAGIGALLLALLGIFIFAAFWWAAIPLLGLWFGGWLGLLFGVGLVTIIAFVVYGFKKDA